MGLEPSEPSIRDVMTILRRPHDAIADQETPPGPETDATTLCHGRERHAPTVSPMLEGVK